MNRRTFLCAGVASTMASRLLAALNSQRLSEAEDILEKSMASGPVKAAVLHVVHETKTVTRSFGMGITDDSMFLLGSISKPICVTALMTLFDQGRFRLDDAVTRHIPSFTGDGRDQVTIRHLLTHVSGLPDQLPENNQLRASHAPLSEFVDHAIRTPLLFAPGTKYQYSSMAILLATHIAERISGQGILELVDRTVLQPLAMKRSAVGLGRFKVTDMVPCQTEYAAPEAGAGDPKAKNWDWNSDYWRRLGAPWGGVHASAPDVGRFLAEFLHARGTVIKPETARLIISNQNPAGLTPRGIGFDLGLSSGPIGDLRTFGHTGSTGTVAWADTVSKTICVVLTSLPGRAVTPHPVTQAAKQVASAIE